MCDTMEYHKVIAVIKNNDDNVMCVRVWFEFLGRLF